MVSKINSGYMNAVGSAITNFSRTLPDYQSDLAQYSFKDPYNFSFIGTMALQHECDIENRLAERMTEFLLELGHGFAYVRRQYNVVVDGHDYYIDIMMYHMKLHCYVVVELKAVEFIPEFVSKLNFYISAIDDYVKAPEEKLRVCYMVPTSHSRFCPFPVPTLIRISVPICPFPRFNKFRA